MALTWTVVLGLLFLGLLMVATVESAYRSRARPPRPCPICKQRGDCDAGLHS